MKALAAELPDLPRWVEVRSMLLSGDGRVIGAVATSPLSFVVLDSSGTAGVVGRPPATAIRAAAEQAREILAVPEDAGWVAVALPEWSLEEATLFVRAEQTPLPVFTENDARLMTAEELARLARRLTRPDRLVSPRIASSARRGRHHVKSAGDCPASMIACSVRAAASSTNEGSRWP